MASKTLKERPENAKRPPKSRSKSLDSSQSLEGLREIIHQQEVMEKAEEGKWNEAQQISQKGEKLYPNTDLSIWLRTGSEVTDPLPGNVSFGKIPIWLSGCLIRNGPGGVNSYGDGSCKHLFDGPGLLQKFNVNNGTATFSCKFIHSRSFNKNSVARRLVLSEFGTVATPDPCQTIFSRIAAVFLGPLYSTVSDNANISIHPFGDEIYSLAETPFAHRIDMDTLDTLTTVDVHHDLGVINHSAHPHICGRKVYNIGQKLGLWLGPHYIIAEMGTKGSSSSKESRSHPANNVIDQTKRNRSSSMTPSYMSSVASSTTNLSSLDDSQVPYQNSVGVGGGGGHIGPTGESSGGFSSSSGDEHHHPHSKNTEADGKTSKKKPKGVSPWSSAKIIATIPSRWPLSICYMHTFSITHSYFILIEQPLSIYLPSVPLHQIYADKPIASCLKFYPEEDTLFHVVSRHSSSKKMSSRKTFRASSFFFLHTINAFEMRNGDSDETFIVIDICTYKNPDMIECMYVDALKNAQSNADYAKLFRGRPKRFLLKLNEFNKMKGLDFPEVESEMIVDIGCETPRINELFDGKPYNYFYAISSDVDLDNPGTLIKVDVLRKTYETWSEPNAYPSEPIFVSRPGSQREDDGVILSTVVYGREDVTGPNRTSLIILNATSWDLLAKVDFTCETAVPKCLHGWFFPDKLYHHFQQQGYSSRESRSLSRQPSKASQY